MLATGGVGAVIAGYLLFKTIPDLAGTFRVEQAETRKLFADEMREQRQSSATQLAALNAQMNAQHTTIVDALLELKRDK